MHGPNGIDLNVGVCLRVSYPPHRTREYLLVSHLHIFANHCGQITELQHRLVFRERPLHQGDSVALKTGPISDDIFYAFVDEFERCLGCVGKVSRVEPTLCDLNDLGVDDRPT